MPIIATANGGKRFEPVSEGVHLATCIKVISIGEQKSEKYGNTSERVILMWEIPDDPVKSLDVGKEDQPKIISNEYTLSLNTKAILRQHLESWRGKKFTDEELAGFDLINVLGKSCQLQILHEEKGGKTYTKVGGVMALPKGMPSQEPVNETLYFDLGNPVCLERLDELPQWIQEKIKNSVTYQKMKQAENPQNFEIVEEDGDLPF